MRAIATDHTAKRLLVRSIRSVYIITHAAFLRGISALDSGCLYSSFGGSPGNLLGYVRQMRRTQIGIHGTRLVLHRGNRKLFVGKLRVEMFGKALVDRAIDLLTDML